MFTQEKYHARSLGKKIMNWYSGGISKLRGAKKPVFYIFGRFGDIFPVSVPVHFLLQQYNPIVDLYTHHDNAIHFDSILD